MQVYIFDLFLAFHWFSLQSLCHFYYKCSGLFFPQDTIIALQALSEYAVFSGSELINLNIEVFEDSSETVATFSIDGTNYGLYQMQEVILVTIY